MKNGHGLLNMEKIKSSLPDVWQRKNLAAVIAEIEGLKDFEGYARADEILPRWKRQGIIKQAPRGITFWQFISIT